MNEQEKKPDWMRSKKLQRFVVKLATNGNVSDALKAAKVSRAFVYEKRKADLDFAATFEEARACGMECLKDEAHRRAHGFSTPVYETNPKTGRRRKVGEKQHYSDSLLMFLIKQSDPSYREHYQIDHGNAGGRPFMFQFMLHPAVAQEQGK